MTNSNTDDPITLVELLEDEEIDFVVFYDNQEEAYYDDFGEAVDAILGATNFEVGVVQAAGVEGLSRSVYLSVTGVIETLLGEIPDDDQVVVDEGAAHLAHGLLQYEVEKLEQEPHPEADVDQYRQARDHFGEALDD